MREDNPEITPAQRRNNVAAILATGVLRYARMAKKTACSAAQESANSGRNCLGPTRKNPPCARWFRRL